MCFLLNVLLNLFLREMMKKTLVRVSEYTWLTAMIYKLDPSVPIADFLVFRTVDSYEPYYIVLLFTPCMFGHCPHLETSLYAIFCNMLNPDFVYYLLDGSYDEPWKFYSHVRLQRCLGINEKMFHVLSSEHLSTNFRFLWVILVACISTQIFWLTSFVGVFRHIFLREFAPHLSTSVACFHCRLMIGVIHLWFLSLSLMILS